MWQNQYNKDMEEKIEEVLQKLEYLEKRLKTIEDKLGIIPPISPDRLPLIKKAALKIYKLPQTSTLFLQKELSLSQRESIAVYDELELRKMIRTKEVNTDDPLQPLKIGTVSKYMIKKFLDEIG